MFYTRYLEKIIDNNGKSGCQVLTVQFAYPAEIWFVYLNFKYENLSNSNKWRRNLSNDCFSLESAYWSLVMEHLTLSLKLFPPAIRQMSMSESYTTTQIMEFVSIGLL